MFGRKKRPLSDFDSEIKSHLDLATEQFHDGCLDEREARYAALRQFGNVTSLPLTTRFSPSDVADASWHILKTKFSICQSGSHSIDAISRRATRPPFPGAVTTNSNRDFDVLHFHHGQEEDES
jgi:hypothetical protein